MYWLKNPMQQQIIITTTIFPFSGLTMSMVCISRLFFFCNSETRLRTRNDVDKKTRKNVITIDCLKTELQSSNNALNFIKFYLKIVRFWTRFKCRSISINLKQNYFQHNQPHFNNK